MGANEPARSERCSQRCDDEVDGGSVRITLGFLHHEQAIEKFQPLVFAEEAPVDQALVSERVHRRVRTRVVLIVNEQASQAATSRQRRKSDTPRGGKAVLPSHGRLTRTSSNGPEYAKLLIKLMPGSSTRGPTPQMNASS